MTSISHITATDLYAALERSELGIAHVDLDGRLKDLNPSLCRVLGYSREELVGRHFSDITHPDDISENIQGVQHLLAGRSPSYRVEKRYLRKDNKLIWVSLLALLIKKETGVPDSMLVFIEDITDRKQLADEKHAIQLRYETLFNQLPDSVILLNSNAEIIGFNDEALRIYEYSAEEMLRLRVTDYSLAYDENQVQEIIRRVMKTGGHEFISRHRTKTGRILDVKVSLRTVQMVTGEVILQCVFRDITAIKQVEYALAQEKANLNAILDNIPHLLWLKNTEGRYITANNPLVAAVGKKHLQEIVGETDFELWPKELAEKFRADDAEVMTTRKRKTLEEYVLDKGRYVWVETCKTPIFGEDGKVLGTTGFARDITERKQAEETLRDSHERLQSALEASQTGTWRVDLRTGLDIRDASLNRMLGLPAEPSTQSVDDWFTYVHPDDVSKMKSAWEAGLISGEYKVDHRLVRHDGKVLWVHDRGVMVRDSTGQVAYAIGAAMDITERMQAVNELSLHANILQNLSEGVQLIRASDGVILYTNSAFSRIFGYEPGELIGQNVSVLNAPTDQSPKDIADQIIRQLNERVAWRGEILNVKKDGSTFWSNATAKPYQHPEFGPVWIAMHQDITERKQAEESMRLAASIYESSTEAIMVTDAHNRIVDVNPAFTRITGYTLTEILGKDPKVLQSGRHDLQFYREMWRGIVSEGHWQGEIWDRRKNGELYAKWVNISVIRDSNGGVYRYIAQFSDITEKKHKDELIWTQANYDVLTKLPNRRLFQDRLELEIRKAHRAGSSIALLLIDLDRFKEINDTLGHAKGDVLLVEAGRRIGGCVRETDTVARLGGDEFTVILAEFSDRTQIERIAQHIIQELGKPFSLGESDLGYISATIGITLYPEDAQDIDSLLKHADQAMYRAKAEGRSRFGYFTPFMQQEAQEKRALTDDLRRALANNELEVYYQPIIELASGRIVKAEALLRWKHPRRGMVGPATFIPLAEESGLILEIGEWVFSQANACVARWRRQFGRIIQVSVNKSPIQFEHPVQENWSDTLVSMDLPGNSITVEITEGVLLKESPRVKQRLLEFRNSGIEVSIDDFGTGFSSLSYLTQFDIDYLKIDRSFIKHLTANESDKALAEAIIVMAHKLGIETIAEGVETKEQRDLLVSFGCDYAQGFLYSPAVPVNEFEKLIEA